MRRVKHASQAHFEDRAKTFPLSLILGAALIPLFTLVAYSPAIRADFIWDDETYVAGNALLRNADGLRRIWFDLDATPQYYPLVHTSFWIEYQLWQLNPAGYHVTNILLHALAALLLWAVLRRLAVPAAFLIAATFALHPVHVESVAWITERKNVLSGVFYLSALLAYFRFAGGFTDHPRAPGKQRSYLLAILLFVCALFSKTVTCSLPAAILLLLWWKRDRVGRRDIRPLIPLFVAGAALGLLTAWLEKHQVGAKGAEWNLSFIERSLIAGRAFWFYVGKLIWPANLTFIYPRWHIERTFAAFLFPIAVVMLVAMLWLARRRIGRGPLTAVLLCLVTLAPALGFFDVYPMRYSFVADHFQYLASVAVLALVIGGATELIRRLAPRAPPRPVRGFTVLLPAFLLVVLGGLTWRQTHVYANLESLWTDTLAKNETAWIAHNNLGIILANQGRTEQAITHYLRVLELKPDHPEAHNNLATLLIQAGRTDEAGAHLREALRYKPDYLEARSNLGDVLRNTGRLDLAADHYRESLRILPNAAELHRGLADTLSLQDKIDEAIGHFQQALKLEPMLPDAHIGLARILADRNQVPAAIDHYQQALAVRPARPEDWNELGALYARVGRPDDARPCYERAVQLSPRFAPACNGLGILAASQGAFEQAAAYFGQALQADPKCAESHYNWANVLALTGRGSEAVQHYRESLRLRPGSTLTADRLAWLLATSSDPNVRNGPEAVRWAESICPPSECKDPDLLATLSAAYAEAGRFSEAVAMAEKGLEAAARANRRDLEDTIRRQLEAYRQGRSCRQDGPK